MGALQPTGNAFGDFAATLFQVYALAVHRKIARLRGLVGVAFPRVNHDAYGEVISQLVIEVRDAIAEHKQSLLLILMAAQVL